MKFFYRRAVGTDDAGGRWPWTAWWKRSHLAWRYSWTARSWSARVGLVGMPLFQCWMAEISRSFKYGCVLAVALVDDDVLVVDDNDDDRAGRVFFLLCPDDPVGAAMMDVDDDDDDLVDDGGCVAS